MANFKCMVEIGSFFIENGIRNVNEWSERMTGVFGRNICPYLDDVFQWSVLTSFRKPGLIEKKLNCWEFRHCLNGENDKSIMINCPAFLKSELNGIFGGRNGGRVCWLVPGTKCWGWVQSTPIHKFVACSFCRFKRKVKSEQKKGLIITDRFLKHYLK